MWDDREKQLGLPDVFDPLRPGSAKWHYSYNFVF
jgi:hypothetical protein